MCISEEVHICLELIIFISLTTIDLKIMASLASFEATLVWRILYDLHTVIDPIIFLGGDTNKYLILLDKKKTLFN